MDKEKVMNENIFDEDAPQAPEFTLDEDNPLKWGDEVAEKVPEFEMPDAEEFIPEEPEMSFEADPKFEQKEAPGWNAGATQQGNWQQGGQQNYGSQQSQGNQQGYNYGYQQYGQQSPYGQPYQQQPFGQPYGYPPNGPIGQKNKIVAGLLAILVGALGIHKFYLGLNQQGIIMLVGSLLGSLLCGLGPIVVGIISLIEGITYLTQTDQAFYEIYEVGRKPWF